MFPKTVDKPNSGEKLRVRQAKAPASRLPPIRLSLERWSQLVYRGRVDVDLKIYDRWKPIAIILDPAVKAAMSRFGGDPPEAVELVWDRNSPDIWNRDEC